ncbi:hypothetical protein Poli38472_002473 [Pythium oligandrum]|uniref:RBR-type E3 ubiquitin transferase n=1 Tax=Pythium oligandrum TaxID=41045 RepID=A0A8K1CHK6_PYTOL|nr:hypothetical protein Poli38472_002473 [Pythium oligandrum]|eukprot:TMW63532.1 hypothetical protein Poli38472_002473 [Pythium oligandrum]
MVVCQICYENAPESTAFTLSECGHQFCRSCFARYLELKIRDGQVYPTCFHEVESTDGTDTRVACGCVISPSDIESVVSCEVWSKYATFKFNKETKHARQCPYCSFSQACDGPEHPEVSCGGCKRVYCYTHGNAHEQGTCADYERSQAELDELNRRVIRRISKPCPGCRYDVEKDGGCNHMTCVVCKADFCWLCEHQIADISAHYAMWNLSGCPGQHLTIRRELMVLARLRPVATLLFRLVLFRWLLQLFGISSAPGYFAAVVLLGGVSLICIRLVRENPWELVMNTLERIAYYPLIIAMWSTVICCGLLFTEY